MPNQPLGAVAHIPGVTLQWGAGVCGFIGGCIGVTGGGAGYRGALREEVQLGTEVSPWRLPQILPNLQRSPARLCRAWCARWSSNLLEPSQSHSTGQPPGGAASRLYPGGVHTLSVFSSVHLHL